MSTNSFDMYNKYDYDHYDDSVPALYYASNQSCVRDS